jgi:hypothetical protein
LTGANKRHNKVHEYRRRIQYLHDNGVVVMSIFLLGLDADTPQYLRALPDMIDEIGVDIPVFSFAAPIEGTPFHRELRDAGRLLTDKLLDGMDGMHLLYRPKHLSEDELRLALFECMRRAYSPQSIARRVFRRIVRRPLVGVSLAAANAFYGRHQRALARSGRARMPRPAQGSQASTSTHAFDS